MGEKRKILESFSFLLSASLLGPRAQNLGWSLHPQMVVPRPDAEVRGHRANGSPSLMGLAPHSCLFSGGPALGRALSWQGPKGTPWLKQTERLSSKAHAMGVGGSPIEGDLCDPMCGNGVGLLASIPLMGHEVRAPLSVVQPSSSQLVKPGPGQHPPSWMGNEGAAWG